MAKRIKTPLDKTILLGMIILTKGSKETFVREKEITNKFARAKRKYVLRTLKTLVEEDFLEKNPKNEYRLTEDGLDEASKALKEGTKLWYMS